MSSSLKPRTKKLKTTNGNIDFLLTLLKNKGITDAKARSLEITRGKPVLYLDHLIGKYEDASVHNVDKSKHIDFLVSVVSNFNEFLQATLILALNWNLCLNMFIKMYEEIEIQINKCLITHGDAVGVIAAQSCSERFTQAALNTFHQAGSKKSAVVGIRRINELLDAMKNISCPMLTKCETKFSERLIGKTMGEICVESGIMYCPSDCNISNFVCFFKILPDIDMSLLSLRKNMNVVEDHLIHCTYPESHKISTLQSEYHKEVNRHVMGIKNAESCEDDIIFLKKGTNIMKTIDFVDIVKLAPDLDILKLQCNDIYFIASTYGISAAESYLVDEIMRVLGAEGININIRHVQLIAANMCVNGCIQPNKYTGVDMEDTVIRKATFEQATTTFCIAASEGYSDKLQDLSSQILLGARPTVGTSFAHLVKPVVETPTLPSPKYALPSPEYGESDTESVQYIPSSPIYAPASPVETWEMIEPDIEI